MSEHGWFKTADGRDVFGPLPVRETNEARAAERLLNEAKRRERYWAPIDPWRER